MQKQVSKSKPEDDPEAIKILQVQHKTSQKTIKAPESQPKAGAQEMNL
jgi:hypothetical protein